MAAKGSEITDLQVELLHETERAYKVLSSATNRIAWVPKSLAELEKGEGLLHILTIPTSIAYEKELI